MTTEDDKRRLTHAAFANSDAARAFGEKMADALYGTTKPKPYQGYLHRYLELVEEEKKMTPEQIKRRYAGKETLGQQQARPDWLARCRLRPDHEELDYSYGGFAFFRDQGVTNLASAKEWGVKWYKNETVGGKIPEVMTLGTRDMAWQLSWYIEALEGRYPEDIGAGYAPDYYLNSRYGMDIYYYILDNGNSK